MLAIRLLLWVFVSVLLIPIAFLPWSASWHSLPARGDAELPARLGRESRCSFQHIMRRRKFSKPSHPSYRN